MQKLNVTETLETLIDQSSLLDVLIGLELVCLEKSAFIVADWQDRRTAAVWKSMSKLLYKLAQTCETKGL